MANDPYNDVGLKSALKILKKAVLTQEANMVSLARLLFPRSILHPFNPRNNNHGSFLLLISILRGQIQMVANELRRVPRRTRLYVTEVSRISKFKLATYHSARYQDEWNRMLSRMPRAYESEVRKTCPNALCPDFSPCAANYYPLSITAPFCQGWDCC
eukprot:1319972-Amorphochlora_amoeboformis.AAC.3